MENETAAWKQAFELAISTGKRQRLTTYPKYNDKGELVNIALFVNPDGSESEEEL